MSRWWEGGSAVTGVGRIAGYVLERYRGLAALAHGVRVRGTGSQQMVVRQMPRFSDEIKLAEQRTGQPTRPVRDSGSTRKERLVEYTIKPGDTLWALANRKFHVHMEDLIK
ncbi:MAG: LysM peptidoglycan-binding domain-containing protein, partial [Thermodesulfobacteriota bacterium]